MNSTTWRELPQLARMTARTDRRTYRSQERTLSGTRLAGLLSPNLRKPVFIIGSPRSGTSFLGRCIASLPEISYHFEPVATKVAARNVYEATWTFEEARRFYRRVYRWLMRLHADGDLRFAEKTPRNCFVVPFLQSAFPDAVFVHIIRDGRDAALSHSEKPWLQAASAGSGRHESGGYPFGPYPRFWVEPERRAEFESTSDIHRCIWAWRRHVESVLAARRALPLHRYHELRYEDLVTQPEVEAERLLDALGIAHPHSRERLRAAVARGRGDSVGRWEHGLSRDAREQIEHEAGPLLASLGYR